jgi:hypothetical protein
MDTVEQLLRTLEPGELDRLKARLVGALIEKKVLSRFRVGGKYIIAIDATHVATYSQDYCGECVYKTLGKEGKKRKVWFHYVLEAKLVTSSGLSISLASEWISNSGAEYDKQDCELKAFGRLSKKIKSLFPRLPICIAGDGLYPNATVFEICRQNGWDFNLTFKDGNLPSVWQEVELLGQSPHRQLVVRKYNKTEQVEESYRWTNGIDYNGYLLNWVEARIATTDIETGEVRVNRFVHITSMPVDAETVQPVSKAGRMRWKIENEGFNVQKNMGYELGHKYSEASFIALQNYYQCLQIAHLINQLVIHSSEVDALLKSGKKLTIKYLWRKLWAFMTESQLETLQKRRCQIRLA